MTYELATWIFAGLAAFLSVLALGLYLQLTDALRLIREERETTRLWRTIANEAWADIVRERHVAEFAVRQLDIPPPQNPLPTAAEVRGILKGRSDA